MGNNEDPTPQSEKTSAAGPSAGKDRQQQEQPAVHPYTDWAAMHAYYGPGMMPSPYFNPNVAPGTAPHSYMWGPQGLMAHHFGSPYAAIFPHGYPHPGMPHGQRVLVQGMPPTPMTNEAVVMASPLSMEMPAKLGNTDKAPSKKLKVLDSASVGNSNTVNATEAEGSEQFESEYETTEGSTDGSDGYYGSEGDKGRRMRSSDGTLSSGSKVEMQINPANLGEASSKVHMGFSAIAPTMDARVAIAGKMKAIGTPFLSPPGGVVANQIGVSSGLWNQKDREVKRERRKQSNRESARRSRLRKQAETEVLAVKVEAICAENLNLRSEINRLTETSDRLRLENFALLERLRNPQAYHNAEEIFPDITKSGKAPVAENFLSNIDNQAMASRQGQQDHESSDKSSGGKLHQLLDARTDAVAAT